MPTSMLVNPSSLHTCVVVCKGPCAPHYKRGFVFHLRTSPFLLFNTNTHTSSAQRQHTITSQTLKLSSLKALSPSTQHSQIAKMLITYVMTLLAFLLCNNVVVARPTNSMIPEIDRIHKIEHELGIEGKGIRGHGLPRFVCHLPGTTCEQRQFHTFAPH